MSCDYKGKKLYGFYKCYPAPAAIPRFYIFSECEMLPKTHFHRRNSQFNKTHNISLLTSYKAMAKRRSEIRAERVSIGSYLKGRIFFSPLM